MHPNLYRSIIYNSQDMERFSDGWMDKEDVTSMYIYACVYTHTHTHTHTMNYYSVIKKNETLPFGKTSVDLKGIMLGEISQTESQMLYDITYMWNLRKYN